MRRAGTILSLALVLASGAGCNSTRWNWLTPADQANSKAPAGAPPTVAALVDYLNDNSNRVRSLRVDDLSVTASQGIGMAPTLNGKLVAEKPKGFRMSLNFGGMAQVDLGSNEQEFWYWLAKAPQPYQFYCSYADLQKGVQFMPIPFQPEWIMESLGIGTYGPAERYQLEHDATTLRLVERSRSPQGHPIRKVIVMNRKPAQAPEPQVTHYLLVDDASGKEICSAHVVETMMDKGTYAVVPRRVDLYWRQENAKLSMTFRETSVNTAVPATAFQRVPLTGVPSYDLARMRPDNIQRAQGVGPR